MRNLTMMTDLYELTMMNGYLRFGMENNRACFDIFYRKQGDMTAYAVAAGLEQAVEYVKNLHFSKDDIAYLRSLNIFDEAFLTRLSTLRFTGEILAVPEGTVIFPGEPIVRVIAPIMEAQLLETALLNIINHQTLIATKSNRIVRAAQGRPVMEFGTRRAQGASAAIDGARASYIAGCAGTACTIADRDFHVPALGTMAHSWVQTFDTEYEAFREYTRIYPDNAVLLIDTYNVLKSGLPNAIKVFKELKPKKMGVRIDSGDIAYLTKKCRKILDENGLEECSIVISNSLDEYLIRDVIMEGAQIDSFGVGERLITSKSEPVFGGVYKLAAVERNGEMVPKMKISENVEKITNPGFKHVYRLYEKESNKAIADVITMEGETIPEQDGYEIFDPNAIWKKKTLKNFYVRSLLVQLFDKGECVYESPSLDEIRQYCKDQIETLWEETLRFENPQTYYVDLSKKLWSIKQDILHRYTDL